MMKRFVIIAAAALTAIGLTACSTSSTKTATTSTTIDGITTTTTTTIITENGTTRKEVVKTVTDEDGNILSVTDGDGNPIAFADEKTEAADAVNEIDAANETEAVAENDADMAEEADEIDEADPTGLRARWQELFSEGAEGENENGDHFFFAYDDRDEVGLGSVMILNADMNELNLYYFGDVDMEDDAMVIYDVDGEKKLPFYIQDGTEEGTFKMAFLDGDVAEMHFVDQDTIINDMVGVVEHLNI
ncbi:MAG: hypothetical protein IJT43_07035 [Stomatobaculum sp.]|nr:hypothetical protein [Stomatobaculum sp.]